MIFTQRKASPLHATLHVSHHRLPVDLLQFKRQIERIDQTLRIFDARMIARSDEGDKGEEKNALHDDFQRFLRAFFLISVLTASLITCCLFVQARHAVSLQERSSTVCAGGVG